MRTIIFLFSLILHIIGLYVVFHFKYSYKIYRYKETATEIFLVPEEIIRFPTSASRQADTGRPDESLALEHSKQNITSSRSAGQKESQGSPSQPGAGSEAGGNQLSNLRAQSRPEIPGESGTGSALASGFRLTYPANSKLNLAKLSKNPVDDLLRPGRYQTRTDINFSKYLYRGGSSLAAGSGSGRPGTGGRPGGGQTKGASVSVNIAKYDFSPWANEVMNKIQKNWSIVQSGEIGWRGEVGVSVLVAKSGQLLAIDVTSTSKIDLLDQAALKALDLSGPFPALPKDFPNSSLDVYFVFQYGY